MEPEKKEKKEKKVRTSDDKERKEKKEKKSRTGDDKERKEKKEKKERGEERKSLRNREKPPEESKEPEPPKEEDGQPPNDEKEVGGADDAPKEVESEEPEGVEEVDEVLLAEGESSKAKVEEVEKKKELAKLKENKKEKQLRRLKSKKTLGYNPEIDSTNPWHMERECLLLLLQARMLFKELVMSKLKEERIKAGELSVFEIQNLLRAQKEEQETDWIQEIQELKRTIVSEIRRNHVLERDLAKLDKRIALLIKNRGNIQEILAEHHGAKGAKAKTLDKTDFTADPRKLEHYSNLFYLLQTEPTYLANLIYLMQPEQMESFLDTLILTLYGDGLSSREEFLILRLFQLSIRKEMSAISNVSDFLKADSVVPKMVITYNRRKQGLDFLKTMISPILKAVIARDINLELKPLMIYQAMISEEEISSGKKSELDRMLNEDQIMQLDKVKHIVKERIQLLEEICSTFLEGILQSISKVPYGIRWICKQIRTISEQTFEGTSVQDEILKAMGYFIYYRFINLAIVTPDGFEVVDKELSPVARKNLITVSKVLQNLFNFSVFGQSDKWMVPLNGWIKKHMDSVREYFNDLLEVPDPEDYLQVDKYMELTQKTKPLIIISLHEISLTHQYLAQHVTRLIKDKDDPLRLILNDLGDPPMVPKEDDREIQLTLTNRFKQNMEEEISATASLYAETKELIIGTFRLIPVQTNEEDQTLVTILQHGKEWAKENKKNEIAGQLDKILENIKSLEAEGMITKDDNYSSFLRDIALEVANRAEIREQQRKEIKRLTQTLRNLRKHQKYLNDQITQYNEYLQDCRMKHYKPKKKKKSKSKDPSNPNKIGPFKFSYTALQKKGVIIDSEVPPLSRKKAYFYISSDTVGVFEIVAKIAGMEVGTVTVELDDLLERNYNNITRLELENVTLDVNMTIHLINKFFLKGTK